MRSWILGSFLVVATAFTVGQMGCATSIRSFTGGAGGEGAAGGSGGMSSSSSSSSSSSGQQGPCTTAADCTIQPGTPNAQCLTAACVNGMCGGLPANELGACEDGKQCTQNDTCQNGVCVGGTSKFCPADDSCHVGSCDVTLDTCIQIPGNDGASCIDDDACTLAGTCSSGSCIPGGMVDCSFLDGTCSVGFCDPNIGCKVMPQADGAPCNDNLYCTVNDVCTGGQCAGVPNTCAAPGDVCLIGTCNEALKTCVAVPGNDGVACNDNNLCTTGEKCQNGLCVGGVPANNGLQCDDGNGCTLGTTCSNGVCGNPQNMVMQCINNDQCCPAGCQGNDNDCLVCHPIIGPPGQGYACPSGQTQFCVPPPLDPSNPLHAKAACEACYGAPCYFEDADCAGFAYGPNPQGQYNCGDAYFGYQSGCTGDDGRVWYICQSGTTYGYWGK